MLVVRKTNLNLKSCYFLFEGIKDQDEKWKNKKEIMNLHIVERNKCQWEKISVMFQNFHTDRIKSYCL